MIRFHIVVFNYERITSFLHNFQKLKNFDPANDCLIIFDCSVNHAAQLRAVIDFAKERGWTLGKEVKVIRRKNWGIDQGARIDYVSRLRRTANQPLYIWQFQEHYLDLESPWSIWANDMPQIGGQVKTDVIPDGFEIDLDLCEQIYRDHPSVSLIYADRAKVGLFTHEDGRESLYTDGANFSVRTSDFLQAFSPAMLDAYKAIYDGSYKWTLFLELDIGRRLTVATREWYDLVSSEHFAEPAGLHQLEAEKGVSLHQNAEAFYPSLYRRYEERFDVALAENGLQRKMHARLSLWYARLLALRPRQRLKLFISRG